MGNYLVDFSNMSWESVFRGQRQKAYVEANRRIRLIELTDEYSEEDWCKKEHLGYVIEGRITIIFNGKSVILNKGDGIFIPKGEGNRHKGKIAKGEKALIIFVEEL